jgi:hypothetical protein
MENNINTDLIGDHLQGEILFMYHNKQQKHINSEYNALCSKCSRILSQNLFISLCGAKALWTLRALSVS